MRGTHLYAIVMLLSSVPAFGDGGMWTFDNFPSAQVQRQYGVDLNAAWLERVRTATIRLSNCTASFVSPEGLILTNHHCAEACIDEHSTHERNLLGAGFLAQTRGQELKCSSQVADVLMATEDITIQVSSAVRGLSDQAANDMRKKTLTQLEQACEQQSANRQDGPLKCESVDLYYGGQYWLYKYHRYQDVRLVFAPEADIASFGGDPDNFQYPRWGMDMSLLRAYGADGKPAATPNFLRIRPEGPKPGELVLAAGHPARTDRMLTVAELETLRSVTLPRLLLRFSELRGRYLQFATTGAEAARITEHPLNTIENDLKVYREQLAALLDNRLLERKRDEENSLRAKLSADAQLLTAIGDPWSDMAKAQLHQRELDLPYSYIAQGVGFNSQLFRYARVLVRAAAERGKPNTERLREYRDSALARLAQGMAATRPVYPALEKLTLSFSLERMREWLGPDAPIVRQLLSSDSPQKLAARLVDGSQLADPKLRQRLWEGGAAAVDAANDPMIVLARAVDAEARALRQRYENEVEAPVDAAAERIARARFQIYGTSEPPDATFTLRLNFGTVTGWKENGAEIEPFTHLARLFERATGQPPFKVPDTWLKAKGQLDLTTKVDQSTSNDITGGNSGSPLVDSEGHLVGLVFDGNIHSIAGSYWFDPAMNRAISVNPAIMVEALRKVYRANDLLAELGIK